MNTLTRKLRKMKKPTMTWRELAEKVGYNSPGLIYKAYHGKCDSPTLRKALGLPAAHVETEPCQKCGGVHKIKSCRKENRKRATSVDRLAARVTVEQGAAIREYLRDKFGFESITEFWLDFFMEEIMRQEDQ